MGIHATGGLLVAETRVGISYVQIGRGIECSDSQRNYFSPEQVRELCPIMAVSHVPGAIFAPPRGIWICMARLTTPGTKFSPAAVDEFEKTFAVIKRHRPAQGRFEAARLKKWWNS